MGITLMTTTGSETDVRAALGLKPEESQATTPSEATISATVDQLPSSVTPPAPPEETPAPERAASEAHPEPDATDDSPQERGAQTKGRLQKRIDELVAARYQTQGALDAAQQQIAKLEAQLTALRVGETVTPTTPATPPKPSANQPPQEADFDTYDAYLTALAKFTAHEEVEQRLAEARRQDEAKRQAQEQEQRRITVRERAKAFAADHPDYDTVIGNPELPNLTPVMEHVLTNPANELGPAMAYALAKNPERFRQIAALSPEEALQEFGVLRAELRQPASPAVAPPKPPAAPPPPTQVRGSAVVAAQSLEDLAKAITPGDARTSDWIARRNAELAKRGLR